MADKWCCVNCNRELKPAPTELGWMDCGLNGKICFECIKTFNLIMLKHQEAEYQQPIQQQGEVATVVERIYNDGFAAGRADGVRECIKKMNEELYFRRGPNSEEPIMYASEIISALEGVGKEGLK